MRLTRINCQSQSEYRTQTKNLAEGADPIEGIPIVSNNNNFAKGSESTLLSFDDGVTLCFTKWGTGTTEC